MTLRVGNYGETKIPYKTIMETWEAAVVSQKLFFVRARGEIVGGPKSLFSMDKIR